MKRLLQFFSFAVLATFTVACIAADRSDAKRSKTSPLQAFQPKGDAVAPSAIIVNGRKYQPGQTYMNGLSAFLPRKKIVRWVQFWLS